MGKVDTRQGYTSKPKYVKGYKLVREYCECGCKQGYWYYVKIRKVKK